jgi:hypothetical protein
MARDPEGQYSPVMNDMFAYPKELVNTMDIPVMLTPHSGDVDPPARIMVQRT